MQQQERCLALVAFGSDAHCESLHSTLEGLGYRTDFLSWERWKNAEMNAIAPVILSFGGASCRSDTAEEVMRKACGVPRLGALDLQDWPWSRAFLGCCPDFFVWPCHETELAFRIRHACSAMDGKPPADGRGPCRQNFARLNLIGDSERFQSVLRVVGKLANCDAPVLLQGETGTGKELVARAVHELGSRRDYPFVPVNCGGIPDNLLENELFGHVRGAYTDAHQAQVGLIAQAEGGSLFLDEIESLSARGQATLLRFLQDLEYKPLGGRSLRKADIRIISASNVDLHQRVATGSFRQDLWFRLNILCLPIPPLRERGGDIALLIDHNLRRFSASYGEPLKVFREDALRWLLNYHWPGNVRELENYVHRCLLICDGPVMTVDELPGGVLVSPGVERSRSDHFADGSLTAAKARAIAQFEIGYLHRVMNEAHGNVSLAARRAGKERRAFGKLLKKYGMSRDRYLSPVETDYLP